MDTAGRRTTAVLRQDRSAVSVVDPQDDTGRLESKLEALDRLRASGMVTDEEYEAKRAQLIADF